MEKTTQITLVHKIMETHPELDINTIAKLLQLHFE
jgi:hypothetical protein